jgi:hypothetical protein
MNCSAVGLELRAMFVKPGDYDVFGARGTKIMMYSKINFGIPPRGCLMKKGGRGSDEKAFYIGA